MKKIIIFIVCLAVIFAVYTTWVKKSSTTQTPVSETPIAKVVLRQDGLEAVKFGATPEEALATLNPVFGQPTKDTGWIDSFSLYGTCPGEQIRAVEWNNLHLLFGDTVHGNKAFFGFEYVDRTGAGKPTLMTERAITLGASKEAIKTAYPDATFGDWLPGQTGTTFVRGAEGSGQYLGGTIENDKLFWIGGGIFCGE